MQPSSLQRPTWAEINLDNLAFNLRSARGFIGNEVECMAVVKADAYGHGAVECARRLEVEGTEWFAVATVEEGIELRSAGIQKPILVLGGFGDAQTGLLIDHCLTPTIFTVNQAESLNAAAVKRNSRLNIHVKLDSGMGRVGFRTDEAAEVAATLRRFLNLNIEGLMTHFAVADDLDQIAFTNLQIERFDAAVQIFRSNGFAPKYIDMANSPAAVAHPRTRSNLVRLGGILYGLGGDVLPAGIDKPQLRPVMAVRSRVVQIKNILRGETLGYSRTFTAGRDSLIGTIPIGYHDGLRRSLSNTGSVLVNGTVTPIVGRVSMDWTTIDLTAISRPKIGDLVTIIGSDHGVEIKSEDLARKLGTISYEITCGISGRVPRIYR